MASLITVIFQRKINSLWTDEREGGTLQQEAYHVILMEIEMKGRKLVNVDQTLFLV